jgi:hypothetical protein
MQKYIPASVMLMADGTRTVAEITITDIGRVIAGSGSAGRERGDKNDPLVGEWLATARALRSAAAHLERSARGRVNHAEAIKAHRREIAVRIAAEEAAMVVARYEAEKESAAAEVTVTVTVEDTENAQAIQVRPSFYSFGNLLGRIFSESAWNPFGTGGRGLIGWTPREAKSPLNDF